MLILGIDPGTATTGYGIIRSSSNLFEVLEFGLITTDKDGTPGKRLENIYLEMTRILKKFSPDVMAIEKLFFAANQGVMIFAAAKYKIEVAEYAPGTIKKEVAGNGRADKKMIQKAIRKVLGAKVRSAAKKKTHFDNAADALAVALCHAYRIRGGDNHG
ncbi:MAG: Crossover junction endodeoxyribonuclease RuvC [Candidatus Woesebacteria bacterium GW2011_GWC2_47_16]|uniref:Crossover junction endodeoxyribonuclease RuvC n=1 Tax=Candidatus Woesebacteria bacterium GW2011_GWC2_47_16 TaxID=1618590 RepID=A0A0G1V242_9BACT|nr:MAG: Crossover junction endodeoxyribonuclease RuvC [Candidatus Woesebacteria bacterium GW2011_GWC2_47_16]